MKSSSVAEHEPEYRQSEAVPDSRSPTSEMGLSSSPTVDAGVSAPLNAPNLSALAHVYAVTSRMAGRLNAASISEDEHADLLRRRQVLLDKELTGTITRSEQNELEYVRWSLDRIEDAKYGSEMDALEESIKRYERFDVALRDLNAQLAKRSEASRMQNKKTRW
jgi:hypothetical protein